jgi:NAD(P) transhydrogenase
LSERYDLVVIGSGPAGEKGAAQAAYFGKRVAMVERADHVGGTGINTGTVPSKTLRETALYFSGLRQRGLYGIDYSLRQDLTVSSFLFRERAVVEQLRKSVRKNLEKHGIDLYWGSASLADAHTVKVTGLYGIGREIRGDHILVATGSSPYHPPGLPFDQEDIYDSDEVLKMKTIPQTLAVLGGGVVGCEYASIFQALDVRVTLVESRDRLLPFLDAEIAERLRARLEQLGMTIIFDEKVTTAVCAGGGCGVTLGLASGREIHTDKALFAAGRQSNVEGLGLAEVGVELGERGLVLVNEHFQTSVPHIYAAGDVIGFPALASSSMEQARVAVCHAFDFRYKQRVSPVLPLAVYTIPEIALVGKNEEELKAAGTPYLVGRAQYQNNPRGQIIGDVSGLVKLIFDPEDRKLLGAHIIGEMASELIHIGAACMEFGGTIDQFIDAVYNYPTLSDAYKYAAYDGLGELHNMGVHTENR